MHWSVSALAPRQIKVPCGSMNSDAIPEIPMYIDGVLAALLVIGLVVLLVRRA